MFSKTFFLFRIRKLDGISRRSLHPSRVADDGPVLHGHRRAGIGPRLAHDLSSGLCRSQRSEGNLTSKVISDKT